MSARSSKRASSVKTSMRLFSRRLMGSVLPSTLLDQYIRSSIKLPELEKSPDLVLKVANTREELEAAFRLLHNNYVANKLMDPHPSGLRVTKHHALPSTSTLIAKLDGRVVGTVSLIRSNSFGLPLEKVYDISKLKKRRARIAEVSALAVDPQFSRQHGVIFWPLIKFLAQYAIFYFGVDYFVIIVHPLWFNFYKALLFFEKLGASAIRYDFVKGALGMGGYCNLHHLKFMLERTFDKLPPEKNLYRYIFTSDSDNFIFPSRKLATVEDPVMSPELLDYFFNQKTDVFSSLSDMEKMAIHQLYTNSAYKSVLPKVPDVEFEKKTRGTKRFEIECKGHLLIPGRGEISISVKNASQSGIGCLVHRKLRAAEEYYLEIETGRSSLARLNVVVAWSAEDGSCGLAITKGSNEWNDFLDRLEKMQDLSAAA